MRPIRAIHRQSIPADPDDGDDENRRKPQPTSVPRRPLRPFSTCKSRPRSFARNVEPSPDHAVNRIHHHQVARLVDARTFPLDRPKEADHSTPFCGGTDQVSIAGRSLGLRQEDCCRPVGAELPGNVPEAAGQGDEGAQRHQEAVRALQG